MATLAITSDLDTIADDETLVTYDGALGDIKVQLPPVAAGGAGSAVDVGVAFEIQNNGDARLEILDNGTGRRVALMEPFSSLVLRSTARVDTPPWTPSDNLKEIIATSEATHIADLSVTDPTTADSAMALITVNTYAASAISNAFDAALNTVIDNFESEFNTATAEVETTLNAILDALEGAGISAAS